MLAVPVVMSGASAGQSIETRAGATQERLDISAHLDPQGTADLVDTRLVLVRDQELETGGGGFVDRTSEGLVILGIGQLLLEVADEAKPLSRMISRLMVGRHSTREWLRCLKLEWLVGAEQVAISYRGYYAVCWKEAVEGNRGRCRSLAEAIAGLINTCDSPSVYPPIAQSATPSRHCCIHDGRSDNSHWGVRPS